MAGGSPDVREVHRTESLLEGIRRSKRRTAGGHSADEAVEEVPELRTLVRLNHGTSRNNDSCDNGNGLSHGTGSVGDGGGVDTGAGISEFRVGNRRSVASIG